MHAVSPNPLNTSTAYSGIYFLLLNLTGIIYKKWLIALLIDRVMTDYLVTTKPKKYIKCYFRNSATSDGFVA